MGFLDKLFRKKEDQKTEYLHEAVIDNEPKCSYCGMGIAETQQVKTYDGKKWHLKPCWREVRKMARNHNL